MEDNRLEKLKKHLDELNEYLEKNPDMKWEILLDIIETEEEIQKITES